MNASNPIVAAATIELFQRHLMANTLYCQKSGTALAEAVQEHTSAMEAQYINCLECLNTFADDAEELQKYIAEFKTLREQLTRDAMQNGIIDGDAPADNLDSIRNRAIYLMNMRLINSVLNHLQKMTKSNIVPPIKETSDIAPISDDDAPENAAAKCRKEPIDPQTVISATAGLAKALGCGKTKAFDIIKSGKLKEAGIQYKAGNCWKFKAEELRNCLKNHPDFLG